MPAWTPAHPTEADEVAEAAAREEAAGAWLSFGTFDMEKIRIAGRPPETVRRDFVKSRAVSAADDA